MSTLKIFHLFFLFLWLGSLLAMTRLFLVAKSEGPGVRALSKKLYFALDLPAMLLAIILGITSAILNGVNFRAGWFHMKMTFALALVIIDLCFAHHLFKGRSISQVKIRIMHYGALISLVAILFAIYVLKPKSLNLPLAKKECQSIISSQSER